jgi:hypothetical protein
MSSRMFSRRSTDAWASCDDDDSTLKAEMPKDCSNKACLSSDAKNGVDMDDDGGMSGQIGSQRVLASIYGLVPLTVGESPMIPVQKAYKEVGC